MQLIVLFYFPLITMGLKVKVPAAVKEETNEKRLYHTILNGNNSTLKRKNQEDMQKYLTALLRPAQNVMNFTVPQYDSTNEHVQFYEEQRSDNIARENVEQQISSTNSQPQDTATAGGPEIIKFELSDASIPNKETEKIIEIGRLRNQKQELIESNIAKKRDMSTSESVMIQMKYKPPVMAMGAPQVYRRASGAASNKIRSIKRLPATVQNVINGILIKQHERNNALKKYKESQQPFKPSIRLNYDDGKWHIQEPSVNIVQPISTPMLTAHHSYSKDYYEPKKYFTTYQKLPLLNYIPNNKEPTVEAQPPPPPLPVYKFVQPQYNYVSAVPLYYKNYEGGGIHAAEVLSIQNSTFEEYLNQLKQEIPNTRPQDSTTPVLFPIDARYPLTKPLIVQNKTFAFVNEVKHPPSYPNYYGSTVLTALLPPPEKDYKPITEVVPEEDDNVIIVPEEPSISSTPPPPLSYPSLRPKLYPNSHRKPKAPIPVDDQDLKYASGYAFGYHIHDYHTGNDYGHTQNQDTDGVTRGDYHILLPDGRIQNVHYTADEKGFHANVTYSDGSKH